MTTKESERDKTERCINTIRMLSVDAVEKAKSGHPGLPMGDAAPACLLWTAFLRHNPQNPRWPNRDRFILSAGHGSMLLYSLLYLTGYDLSLDEIKQFRQWGSRTAGHPEYDPDLGIETTTGPLGQGFANGIGMAIAERYLGETFNRTGYPIVDYHTYALVSDGDLMEGISSEAASMAGNLGLGKVVYIYLDNRISIEGSTDITFTEDVAKRFEAYQWHVEKVDGNDCDEMRVAIERAKGETAQPSLIIARTHIGHGSPNKQDTSGVHGSPLGEEELKLTKERLGWPLEPTFYVPDDVLELFRGAVERGREMEEEWKKLFDAYGLEYPELAAKWRCAHDGALPEGWREGLPAMGDSPVATRSVTGSVLNGIAEQIEMLIGGSADLAPSTGTHLKQYGDFIHNPGGRNLHFGVREHAMGGILNGMALSGALIPYGSTFLIFSDYMKNSIRLAAMMKLHVIYVFTHDSIGLGEDGPTHQPIEQLAALRAIPGLTVIRPADGNEAVAAWEFTLEKKDGPVALIMSRQKLPIIDSGNFASATNLARGGYVLADSRHGEGDIELILIATGAEIHLALGAYEELTKEGIAVRVVSMPSWELFEGQDQSYRDEVLPPLVTARLAVEAASPMGWRRYVGLGGDTLCIDHFGASAPAQTLFEKFGFTVENLIVKARALLGGKVKG